MSRSSGPFLPAARHSSDAGVGVVGRLFRGVGLAMSAVLVAVLCIGAYVFVDYSTALNENSIVLEGQDGPDAPDIEVLPNEPVNILLTGVDACEAEYLEYFGGRCTEEVAQQQADTYAGVLNDVNMLLHISPEPRRITVISIPRDLMTARPTCTDADGNETWPVEVAAFNESYGTGGLPCVVRTAEELTGMNIDHAAMLTWGGVIEITDAIGGVDVCVAEPINDPQHTGLVLDPGEYTMQGLQALQFLRVRTSIGDGSDLSRISNQQVYMGSLAQKLVSEETLTSVPTLLRLANAVVNNASLSTGMTNPVTMVQIAQAGAGVPLEDYVFVQFPAVDYAPNPNKVAPDTYAWDQLKAMLDQNQPIRFEDEEEEVPEEVDPEQQEEPGLEEPQPTDTPEPELPSNLSGSSAANTIDCGEQGLF